MNPSSSANTAHPMGRGSKARGGLDFVALATPDAGNEFLTTRMVGRR